MEQDKPNKVYIYKLLQEDYWLGRLAGNST